jgi:energy-converting hydrogenase Eha subunit A
MQRPRLTKMFAVFGICAATLDIPIIIAIGELRPHYNSLVRFASALGITGKPYAMIISGWWIAYGVMLCLFAVGLLLSMRREIRLWWVGPLLIMIFAIFDGIGSGIFPCDIGCEGKTIIGMMHHVVSTVGTAALLPAPLFMWRVWRKDHRWKRYILFTITVQAVAVVVFIALASARIDLAAASLGKIAGLLQRMFYFIFYLWMILVGVRLFSLAKRGMD